LEPNMTGEATLPHASGPPGPYGSSFLAVPEAETRQTPLPAPDESEAALSRLRAPFDIGLGDASAPAG
jgi:hypothetical protein